MTQYLDVIAGFDNENNIRIECEIKGLYKSTTYGAIADTGFSGSLVLPLIIAVNLGLEKAGATTVTIADGSIMTLPVFLSKVKIGSTTVDADTIVMGNDILIGMGVLEHYDIFMSQSKNSVTLTPSTTESGQQKPAQNNTINILRYQQQPPVFPGQIVETLRRLTGRE